MESVKISTKKCKIAIALAGHHTAALRQRPWVRIPLNYRNFFPVDLQLLKLNCNYDCDDDISATDPDLQIRGGGGGFSHIPTPRTTSHVPPYETASSI